MAGEHPVLVDVRSINRYTVVHTATIPSGQTKSTAIDGRGFAAYGLVMPSAFTGTALTFEVSADGSTYQPLYDAFNVQVSVSVAAGRSYDLPAELVSWPYWRIVSSAAEAAERTLIVVAKG